MEENKEFTTDKGGSDVVRLNAVVPSRGADGDDAIQLQRRFRRGRGRRQHCSGVNADEALTTAVTQKRLRMTKQHRRHDSDGRTTSYYPLRGR
ncbi:hypothetical protein Sjap_013206 [Stephania japonica]|uniref:Uncharacterized protein n=1 Tax=Stephania japonica TaxID=461633 RepID=A0AAP0IXG8_9MAGN